MCCINGSFHVYNVKICCSYGKVRMDTVQAGFRRHSIHIPCFVKNMRCGVVPVPLLVGKYIWTLHRCAAHIGKYIFTMYRSAV